MQSLDDGSIAKVIAPLDADHPRNPHVHFLLRAAVLIGPDFCTWLFKRWKAKWDKFPQPLQFYFAFKDLVDHMKRTDHLVVAARTASSATFRVDDRSVTLKDLLASTHLAETLLSRTCMDVFSGTADRSLARTLDFIAYGATLRERGKELGRAVMSEIGDRPPGDPVIAGKAP